MKHTHLPVSFEISFSGQGVQSKQQGMFPFGMDFLNPGLQLILHTDWGV